MKRAIVVHCWGGYPEYCWYPYAKRELEKEGFAVEVPAMPDTDAPSLSKWLPKLKEVVGTPDKDLYLIGHSAGCVTIMKYLQTLSEDQKVGGVVLVAGYTHDLGFDELKNFFETPLNLEKIRSRANHFVVIASDNDPYVPIDQADVLKVGLGAETIIKHNAKHFSGASDGEEACTELPDVVQSILKFK